LKQLDKLIVRSYVAPFLMTFAISCFFLVMQFLWKYVDDLMGKGLEWYVIAELMGLASVKLVILALPLSILLSSIMVMGSFAENSELVAMKSAGMSLFRILRPLFAVMLLIALGSFLFTNEVWPVANLKFRSLLYDVTKKKPSIQLEENIFYEGIEDYTIRVKDKKEDGGLEDVLIYDHSDPEYKGNRRVVRAERGSMKKTEDERYLLFKLYDGVMYQEMDIASGRGGGKNAPHLSSRFEEQVIRFDLMGFQLERSNEGLFSKDKEMLDLQQLGDMVDSLEGNIRKRKEKSLRETARNLWVLKDSGRTELGAIASRNYEELSPDGREAVFEVAKDKVRKNKERIKILMEKMKNREKMIRGYNIEWHRKFTLSFACVVLFFIGGPLGAIIRKGGMGAPFVAGVLLFILYFILMKVGEETAGEGAIPEWVGMWSAPLLLLPLGIWLTYRAANESKVIVSLDLRSLKKRFLRK
jgi:lipopolysaccharide export system permease protein